MCLYPFLSWAARVKFIFYRVPGICRQCTTLVAIMRRSVRTRVQETCKQPLISLHTSRPLLLPDLPSHMPSNPQPQQSVTHSTVASYERPPSRCHRPLFLGFFLSLPVPSS